MSQRDVMSGRVDEEEIEALISQQQSQHNLVRQRDVIFPALSLNVTVVHSLLNSKAVHLSLY